ncbi:MAG TPA: tail fiber protein [Blastocatellia bacterium]|nr:tail fiber protein [Blastocatellia bacterium]
MSEPFLAEIRLFTFNFPPKGWALCNGQLLPINQNQALFSLLGTTYGGDGRVNFALPNLRGRVPIHRGNGHTLGEAAGSSAVTLTASQMPQHAHLVRASSSNGNTNNPSGTMLARALNAYRDADNLTSLSPGSISNVGGSQPHENRQPFLTLNFCIALQGIFPSRN